MRKLEAAMVAWKTRRILGMKEVKSKAMLVKDHDKDNVKQSTDVVELKQSRRKAYKDFKNFFDTISKQDNWLMLNRERAPPKVKQNFKASRGSQSHLRPANIS